MSTLIMGMNKHVYKTRHDKIIGLIQGYLPERGDGSLRLISVHVSHDARKGRSLLWVQIPALHHKHVHVRRARIRRGQPLAFAHY